MLTVLLRAVILYILIIFSIRLMGKRQIGELQPSELVVTILVSNIATLPIEDITIPMIMGVVPILTLVSLDVFAAQLSLKSGKLRRLFSGQPKIIISGGRIDQKMMRSLRYTVDDLMESLRGCSVFDINDVQLAVVETTGKLSVYQKQSSQPATKEDMKVKSDEKDPPQLIITDGEVNDAALRSVGRDRTWLKKITSAAGVSEREVFMLTADTDGEYSIIKKEGQ
ncbi:MAG: DUF421 domain-containing protein [Ruminococcus sp.]|nr:DUF421 domain-containing protein [Ruminococcus sp.]